MTENFEDHLSCPVCLQYFHDPKSLSCGHSVCNSCIAGIRHGDGFDYSVRCPLCRQHTNTGIFPGSAVGDLPTNRSLKSIVDLYRDRGSGAFQAASSAGREVLVACRTEGCERAAAASGEWRQKDFWICLNCDEGQFCSTCIHKNHSGHTTKSYIDHLMPKIDTLSRRHSNLQSKLGNVQELDRRRGEAEVTTVILDQQVDRYKRLLNDTWNGLKEQQDRKRARLSNKAESITQEFHTIERDMRSVMENVVEGRIRDDATLSAADLDVIDRRLGTLEAQSQRDIQELASGVNSLEGGVDFLLKFWHNLSPSDRFMQNEECRRLAGEAGAQGRGPGAVPRGGDPRVHRWAGGIGRGRGSDRGRDICPALAAVEEDAGEEARPALLNANAPEVPYSFALEHDYSPRRRRNVMSSVGDTVEFHLDPSLPIPFLPRRPSDTVGFGRASGNDPRRGGFQNRPVENDGTIDYLHERGSERNFGGFGSSRFGRPPAQGEGGQSSRMQAVEGQLRGFRQELLNAGAATAAASAASSHGGFGRNERQAGQARRGPRFAGPPSWFDETRVAGSSTSSARTTPSRVWGASVPVVTVQLEPAAPDAFERPRPNPGPPPPVSTSAPENLSHERDSPLSPPNQPVEFGSSPASPDPEHGEEQQDGVESAELIVEFDSNSQGRYSDSRSMPVDLATSDEEAESHEDDSEEESDGRTGDEEVNHDDGPTTDHEDEEDDVSVIQSPEQRAYTPRSTQDDNHTEEQDLDSFDGDADTSSVGFRSDDGATSEVSNISHNDGSRLGDPFDLSSPGRPNRMRDVLFSRAPIDRFETLSTTTSASDTDFSPAQQCRRSAAATRFVSSPRREPDNSRSDQPHTSSRIVVIPQDSPQSPPAPGPSYAGGQARRMGGIGRGRGHPRRPE